MEHQESSVEIFEKFTWKIENFCSLDVEKIYSKPFIIDGYPWRIVLYPRGHKVDDKLSIYLEAMQTANMSQGWGRDVKFELAVFNQLDTNITITKGSKNKFNASGQDAWGFKSFMSLSELHDPKKGFIVKNVCIVGAEVFVCKSNYEKQVSEATNLTESKKIHIEVEVEAPPHMQNISPFFSLVCNEPTKQHIDAELFYPSIEEIMDFTSVGQLEEIYFDHPSLIECKFIDLAFAALGRVTYFIKTRKVKDMNEQACEDLQVLWEELEKFRFDLSWLEPHVLFALGMKSYVEKAMKVEKLKENVAALEMESERLKEKLVVAEINLNIEKDLLKAKRLEEIDLESELGCGR